MKGESLKRLKFLCFTIFVSIQSFAQIMDNNYLGTFKDTRDGHEYKWVKIGDQIWMADNLNAKTFINGDLIPEIKDIKDWRKSGFAGEPALCDFANDPTNGDKFGKLYNWHTVNDSRGLAPTGWHIPSEAEWSELITFLGGEKFAGGKLKSKEGWYENGNGDNESGFSGVAGGYRTAMGKFSYMSDLGIPGIHYDSALTSTLGYIGIYWSSSRAGDKSYKKDFSFMIALVTANFIWKEAYVQGYGFSVRCIKDK